MSGRRRRRKRKRVQQRRKKRRKTKTLRSKTRRQVQVGAEGKEDGDCVKGFLRPGFIADREKVTEEKEKDKEMLAAAETVDAKAASEVLDLKKGVSGAKWRLTRTQSCIYTEA